MKANKRQKRAIANGYIPFGDEWAKETMKLPIPSIEIIFDRKIRTGEKKKDFIERIGLEKRIDNGN